MKAQVPVRITLSRRSRKHSIVTCTFSYNISSNNFFVSDKSLNFQQLPIAFVMSCCIDFIEMIWSSQKTWRIFCICHFMSHLPLALCVIYVCECASIIFELVKDGQFSILRLKDWYLPSHLDFLSPEKSPTTEMSFTMLYNAYSHLKGSLLASVYFSFQLLVSM